MQHLVLAPTTVMLTLAVSPYRGSNLKGLGSPYGGPAKL